MLATAVINVPASTCCSHQLRAPETRAVQAKTSCVVPKGRGVVSVQCKDKKVFKQTYVEEKPSGKKEGFSFNPATNMWVKKDNAQLLDDPDFDPKVQPKSGIAYTIWPVCHAALKEW
eukprot:9487107-Pyramimonas_sp.AAC.1